MTLNKDQFGLTPQEQSEITGKAVGGHIFDQIEGLFGGEGSFRQAHVTEAWADAHANFQGHNVVADEEDFPIFKHKHESGWDAHYPIGGPYITMYQGDQPVEALHVDKEDRKNPNEIIRRVQSWVDESSEYY
jgi:hypothetical protein